MSWKLEAGSGEFCEVYQERLFGFLATNARIWLLRQFEQSSRVTINECWLLIFELENTLRTTVNFQPLTYD